MNAPSDPNIPDIPDVTYQTIGYTKEDAQAILKVLMAARSLDGILFTHEEWDHAMSAFGRMSIIAQARQQPEAVE
jgi:hypothetical protein